MHICAKAWAALGAAVRASWGLLHISRSRRLHTHGQAHTTQKVRCVPLSFSLLSRKATRLEKGGCVLPAHAWAAAASAAWSASLTLSILISRRWKKNQMTKWLTKMESATRNSAQ